MTTIVNNNDNNNNSKKTENQNIKTKIVQEPEDDFLDIITSIYKYHVSYPSLNIPMKINFNSSGRKLQPTLPRDKRCIFQFATRTKTDFKRIHSHTLVGSSFYLHSGLCDKSKLAILIEDYFSKIPQNNVNNHIESSTIDNTKLKTTTNVNTSSNNKGEIIDKTTKKIEYPNKLNNRHIFIPSPSIMIDKTFIINSTIDQIKQFFNNKMINKQKQQQQPWCMKASNVNNSLGVKFYKDLNTLIDDLKRFVNEIDDTTYLIQPYVNNVLTYQRKKCHVRLNVLIVGGNVNVFIHRDCIVHVAAKEIVNNSTKQDYNDRDVHVTNHLAKPGQDIDKEKKVITLMDLEKDTKIPNLSNDLFQQMCTIIQDVFKILHGRGDLFLPIENSFELFGADFLIQRNDNDESLKCILLEINSGPGLEGRVDRELCTSIMNDTLQIVFDPWYSNLLNVIKGGGCSSMKKTDWMNIDAMPSIIPERYCYLGSSSSGGNGEDEGVTTSNTSSSSSSSLASSRFLLSDQFMEYLYKLYQFVLEND